MARADMNAMSKVLRVRQFTAFAAKATAEGRCAPDTVDFVACTFPDPGLVAGLKKRDLFQPTASYNDLVVGFTMGLKKLLDRSERDAVALELAKNAYRAGIEHMKESPSGIASEIRNTTMLRQANTVGEYMTDYALYKAFGQVLMERSLERPTRLTPSLYQSFTGRLFLMTAQ